MRTGAEGPLSSAFGTIKTVEAQFWPWLERAFFAGEIRSTLRSCSFFSSCDVSAEPLFVEENSIRGSEIGF